MRNTGAVEILDLGERKKGTGSRLNVGCGMAGRLQLMLI